MSSSGRIGRPRAQQRLGGGDPSEEILAAASRLFGEHGVTGTTMAQIAQGAGLRQSSLYYYFRSKEEVLAALVAKANVVPLELVRRIRAEPGTPAVRLYRFVHGDVAALCALPFDINEVHRYASHDRDRFATYWKERRTLQRELAKMVREGVTDGSFRAVDPRFVAITLMSNDEAVQNWFRHDTRPLRDVHAIASAVAELSIAGLLSDPGAARTVASDARAAVSKDLRK